jgi:hypothetical protein
MEIWDTTVTVGNLKTGDCLPGWNFVVVRMVPDPSNVERVVIVGWKPYSFGYGGSGISEDSLILHLDEIVRIRRIVNGE